MKNLIACVCTFWVAGLCATEFTQPASLPLGSRAALDAQVENVVTWAGFVLTSKRATNYIGFPYEKSMGPLTNVLATNMSTSLNSVLKPSDAGTEVQVNVGIFYERPNRGPIDITDAINIQTFTVCYTNGNLVIPYQTLLAWPLARWVIPVPNMLSGVENVEYIYRDSTGRVSFDQMTKNGIVGDCPFFNLIYGDNVLYLDTASVGHPAWLLSIGVAQAEVILHYDRAKGLYDAYDIFSGNKIRSTVVRLSMTSSNGLPCVTVTGFPGTQVALEQSSTGSDWTTFGSVTLNAQGKETLSLPASASPLLVRGRLVTP